MGELVRRLDYERRSKKNLLVDCGSGQRINREYSAPVRAANDMEDRKRNLYLKTIDKHKKLFLNRFGYEKKVVLKFKDELDAKSENFTEEKYQTLRAQSAAGRLQRANEQANIGPVLEIIPRHYYRGEARSSAVKFDISPETSENESDSEFGEDMKRNDKKLHVAGADNVFKPNVTDSKPSGFATTIHWATLTKKPPSAELRRRRVSLGADSHRFLPARGVRRLSAPSRVMSALEPRDVKSSRRSSHSSLTGSVSSLCETGNNADDNEVNSKSFRLLREAFKKKKKEKPNPKLEKLNSVKADHVAKTCHLHDKTKEKFDNLFNDDVLSYY